jgi:hypothetical protein
MRLLLLVILVILFFAYLFKPIKIGVCSLAIGDEYKKTVSICTESQERYTELQKYDYIHDESVYDKERHPSWSKIKLLRKYLPSYDYLMWIDADAMFTNHTKRIEELLPFMSDKECMLICEDDSGINCGVFLIKNTDAALKLLDDIWACNEHHNGDLWEQDALKDIFPNVKENIKILKYGDNGFFNSYPVEIYKDHYWKKDDFIIHFASVRGSKLIDLQNKYSTTN